MRAIPRFLAPSILKSSQRGKFAPEPYKDVASRFKADLAKQEQARQNAIKQDLAKRMAPKKQPQKSYYREPEGRSR